MLLLRGSLFIHYAWPVFNSTDYLGSAINLDLWDRIWENVEELPLMDLQS